VLITRPAMGDAKRILYIATRCSRGRFGDKENVIYNNGTLEGISDVARTKSVVNDRAAGPTSGPAQRKPRIYYANRGDLLSE